MKVIIIRHGKVDFQWQKRYTSTEFDKACAEYDAAPLEGRSQTRARAEEFVRLLRKEKRDAVVITHGFYMHMLLKAFKHAGFRVRKTHVHYRNGEYVLVEKDL